MNKDNAHVQLLNLMFGAFISVWTMKHLAEKSNLPYVDEFIRLAESFTIHMLDMDAFQSTLQSEISDEFLAECLASGDYKNLQSFVQFAEQIKKPT